MTDDTEIDVDALRTELDQIKDAMGIQERSAGATSVWLLFGVLVPIAAAVSQYVHLERLPAWLHPVAWLGVLGGGYALWWAVSDEPAKFAGTDAGKPNVGLQFAVVYLAAFPLQTVVAAYTPSLGYRAESALVVSIVLVLLGVAYAVLGSSLKAYYIRRRDRVPFYVGTVWMVGLGVAIPLSATLETWAYAVFGGLYFVYAVGTYLWLTST
jgi:hypothetical protein